MIRYDTDPEPMSDAELCAAWHHACEAHDDAAMDLISDEIEKRGLDL